MLIEHARVAILQPDPAQAYVHVNPQGSIEVDLPVQGEHFEAEFDHLNFRHIGEKIEMICDDEDKKKCWHLALSQRDGSKIEHLIDDANQDYEQLMRDLF